MTRRVSARQYLGAFMQRPRDAVLALHAGGALFDEGFEEEAVAVWSLGDDLDPRLRRLGEDPNAPEDIRTLSARADSAFCKHFTLLHRESAEGFGKELKADVSRVANGIWPLTHDGAVEFREPMQEPVIFYMPDLPAAAVSEKTRLPWVSTLERAQPQIKREYKVATEKMMEMAPYVPEQAREKKWEKLRGTQDWSSIHLFKEASRTSHAAHFPETIEALKAVDLVSIDGEPMEVFFSRLRPGAHIPPHFGLTNSRVTVHLPLIVPEDCAIRVGKQEYQWSEGEIIAFDDSFEHEAWNRSGTDRVVLIFEAPHPDLSEAERKAIENAYSVRQNWLDGRRRLLEQYFARA